uniref:Nucleolar GTP-binding protein 2 n=1 Tax=Amorphochlora amoebiformis TaxID=1561963 RepID=A0A7S0DNX9_9EUKA|mmetsp:Transcript_32692/g.52621  ORF Transcript_32692/g.52621 Transcript_32692/m.52621 type:complete len:574 (+) Transcript_32692:182-1903(+)
MASGKPYKGKQGISFRDKINNPYRVSKSKDTNRRSNATIKRLALYKSSGIIRDRDGKPIGGDLVSTKPDAGVKRIAPDRRWFGNTRVVGAKALEEFREEMSSRVHDPYTVLMKAKKLPMGLLSDPYTRARANLLTTESFETTFGKNSRRKRPRLGAAFADIKSLAKHTQKATKDYEEKKEDGSSGLGEMAIPVGGSIEKIFEKGTSKRLWKELYKVLDSSDVVVQVLDARDPMGTRSKKLERELKTKEKRHKHLVFVLNKCDLVPTWCTRRWVRLLSQEYPTLAFHASITNPFGKGALIQLLRQFATLHQDKQQISVGFVGYPNVGKSSIVNTLRKKKVCNVAPIPGETKVWQYITLFRRVFLIDCPGVVPPSGDNHLQCVLKGVVQVEKIEDPSQYIIGVLESVKREYLERHYEVIGWNGPEEFLTMLARKTGKLKKGGEPDFNNTARKVLQDFQRGRLPYFVPPPHEEQTAGTGGADEAKEKRITIQAAGGIKVEQLFDKVRPKSKFLPQDNQDPALRGENLDEDEDLAIEGEDYQEGKEEEEGLSANKKRKKRRRRRAGKDKLLQRILGD